MHRMKTVFRFDFVMLLSLREYAEEALKHAKVFSEVAMETFEKVAAETVNSKLNQLNNWKYSFIHCLGAKEFANEAVVFATEFSTNARGVLEEKVPVILETSKEYAAKAVEFGQVYGKEAYEKTTEYAGQAYKATAETVDSLVKTVKDKYDL